MALPSLFDLSLLNLSVTDTLQVCGASFALPSCGENIWPRKAEKNLKIPSEFFDLYLGSPLSTRRPISESYRYLELASVNNFLPEAAVSRDVKTGQISGLFESLNGVKEAILRGDEQQFEFFFPRLKPNAIQRLNFLFEYPQLISDLFPQGPNQVSFDLFVTFCQRLGFWNSNEGKVTSPAQDWIIRDTPGRSLEEKFQVRASFNAPITDLSILNSYLPEAILLLIEKGQESALTFLLGKFRRGEMLLLVSKVFIAVLRSGNFDFFDAFSPYFPNVGLETMSNFHIPNEYFIAAAYGGNPTILNFLLEVKGTTFEEIIKQNVVSFINLFVDSTLLGFFSHRKILWTYDILRNFPLQYYSNRSFLSSVPIDFLDLIYYKTSTDQYDFYNSSVISLLTQTLASNLGQLNVVFFCLNQLEKYIHEENFYIYFNGRISSHAIHLNKDLTPLSVRLVEDTVKQWKSKPTLPPLV